MITEPFTGYRRRPSLRALKHRKTMTVGWDACGLRQDEHAFRAAVDCAAMNAELMAIWLRAKRQCDRRGSFGYGGVIGCMAYVPVDAGMEAMAVVREHFTRALERIAQTPDGDLEDNHDRNYRR